MTLWQNAFNNLLVVGILVALGIIIYCKIKQVTFIELVKQIKEIFSNEQST